MPAYRLAGSLQGLQVGDLVRVDRSGDADDQRVGLCQPAELAGEVEPLLVREGGAEAFAVGRREVADLFADLGEPR
jgi:hypothetical protein